MDFAAAKIKISKLLTDHETEKERRYVGTNKERGKRKEGNGNEKYKCEGENRRVNDT